MCPRNSSKESGGSQELLEGLNGSVTPIQLPIMNWTYIWFPFFRVEDIFKYRGLESHQKAIYINFKTFIKSISRKKCQKKASPQLLELKTNYPCNISRTNFVSGTVGERSEPLRDF